MSERIGLEGVFDISNFEAGVGRYLSGFARATGATALFTAGFNAIDQVFTGFLRRIGSDVNRALFRFAGDMVDAAVKGTELETEMGRLTSSLASVSRASFAPLVAQLDTLVENAAPAFLGVVQAAESYLGGLGQNALTWGSNVVNQFAQGMWNAIGSVLDALTGIADAVSYWLSPGSPPKILPDIDQWGTDAANEWLGGWSKGNFSVFNDLSSTLTNLINSLPVPKGGELDVMSRILGTREGIAQAVEELKNAGTVSAATMDAIVASVGTADANVRAYLDSLIHLQAANQTVADAQDALNKVTKEYDDLLKPVEDRLAAIDEASQQFDEDQKKANLAKVLLDPGATASEKRRAQMEIERIDAERARRALIEQKKTEVDAAQSALDAAKEGQSAAADEFDAKKAALALLAEQNKLLKQQMDLIDRLNNPPVGGGGGGGPKPGIGPKPAGGKVGGGGPLFDIKPFDIGDLIPDGIKEKWDAFVDALGAAWDRIKDKFKPAIDAINTRLIPAFNNLLAAVREKMPLVEAEIGRVLAFMVDESAIAAPEMVENISKALDSLADIWRNHGATIIKIVGFAIRAGFAALLQVVNTLIAGIALALDGLATVMDVGSLALQGKWGEAWERLKSGASEAWDIITGLAKTNWDILLGLFGTNSDEVLAKLGVLWESLKTGFGEAWETIKTTLGEKWDAIKGLLSDKWDAIKTTVTTALGGVSTSITTKVDGIKTAWETRWQAIKDKLSDIWEGIKTTVHDAIQGVLDRITERMDEIDPKWREDWEKVKSALAEKWTAMVDSVRTKISEVQTAISDKLSEIQTFWGTVWDAVKTKLDEIWGGVKTTVDTKIDEVKTKLDTTLEAIKTKWGEIWDGFKTKVDEKWAEIKTAIDTAIEAVKKSFTDQEENLKDVGRRMIDSIKTGIENAITGLVNAAAQTALAVLRAIMAALGMASPSKKGLAIGANLGKSIADGIMVSLGKIQVAGSLAGSGALQAASMSSNSISNSYATHYHLNVNSNLQSQGIRQDFRIMEAMEPY